MPFKSSSSFLLLLLFLLPLAVKKVSDQWTSPLCSSYTHCRLIVTRWTLTAQPALTMCLLDTAACGTLAPRPPRVPWAPELCLCWTVRSSLWRRRGGRGVKRLFVCLKKRKEDLEEQKKHRFQRDMQENIYPVLQYSHSAHCLTGGGPTILLYP